VSTGAVAIGTLINNIMGVRSADVCSSLFGSASLVTLTDKDLWLSVVLSALVLVWYVLCARRIFAVTFDEPFARSAGVHTEGLDLVMAILTGITIVVGMKMMGAIMISALILFPPMTAMRITGSFRATVWVSAVVSVVSFVLGFVLACLFSLQTGATVVTVQLVMFCIFAAAGRIIKR